MASESTSIFQNILDGDEKGRNRNTTLSFRMAPTHVSYANTLRRLCVAHVPTVAFRADILENDIVDETGRIVQAKGSTSDVQILENTTPMTNEMLAHRIGLLPIDADPEVWESQEMYKKVVFELKVVNEHAKTRDVTTDDFTASTKAADGLEPNVESAGEYFPKFDSAYPCLIATLKPFVKSIQSDKETIHLRARASVGIGRENARFIPVSRATYSYTRIKPDVVSPEAMHQDPDIQAAYADWAGKKNVNLESLKTATDDESKKKEKALWNEFITTPIQRYYIKDEQTDEPNSFDFVIESVTSQLNPRIIVQRALQAGINLCKRYEEGGAGWATVTVQRSDTRFYGFDFYFKSEDHTLGNLVQTYIDQKMMDNPEKGVTFVGYDIPHPLKDEMVLRLGVPDDSPPEFARKLVQEAMTGCSELFAGYLANWETVTIGGKAASQPTAVGGSAIPATRTLKRAIKRPAASTS